ncbi:cell cycle control protein 50A-like [Ornithodoros turicata]|uniref:cell cycle control protein 50A-like n=1 Tax=Ornithodoros turicata TaxID=34597 RepID=UPI003139EBE4
MSHRPIDTPFKQQRLGGWKPLFTAETVMMKFMVVGGILTAVGVAILLRNKELQEYQFDYTNCKQVNSNRSCASLLQANPRHSCVCLEAFQLPQDFQAPVFMYYGLSRYHQNFRRYVQSRDDKQLLGNPLLSRSQCEPFRFDKSTDKTYYPCGAVANSFFNDTLRLKYKGAGDPTYRDIDLIFDGISWPTDRQRKFKNPPASVSLDQTAKPHNWLRPVKDLKDGIENEALIVWMRTAALPTFRKLYAIVDHQKRPTFGKALPTGNYLLEVHYNYPVWQFDGRKLLVLANAGWLGSRNPFLGIVYVCVGSLCLSLTIVFFAINRHFGSKKFPMPELSAFWEPPLDTRRLGVPPVTSMNPSPSQAGTQQASTPQVHAPEAHPYQAQQPHETTHQVMRAYPMPTTAPHGRHQPVRRK